MKDRLITIGLILFMLAFVGFVIYLHISTTQDWLLAERLREEGMTTAVTVLQLSRHDPHRGTSYCQVDFAYTLDGSDYSKTTKVSADFCSLFNEGDQANAYYLAGEPETADLTWGGYTELQFFILLLCDGLAILLAITATIAYWLNKRSHQQTSNLLQEHSDFPLTIKPPRGSQLMEVGCMFPFGLLVTVLMGGAMAAGIINWREMPAGLPIVLILSASPFLAFGLLIIYLALKDFVHSFIFTAEQIHVRHILFKNKTYPASHLQKVKIEVRPLRGQRKAYALVLQFQDGTAVDMQHSNSADEYNTPPQSLRQIQAHLKQLYHLS